MQSISVVAALESAALLRVLQSWIDRQEDIALSGEAHDGDGMLHVVALTQPDVLLLDDALSQGSEPCSESALLLGVHRSSPQTKVLLLSDTCTERGFAKAFQHGARGCISTSALAEEGVRALRAVGTGELWIGRRMLASLLDDLLSRLGRRDYAGPKWATLLTEREREVANGVRLGLTNKEIARRLRISDTTVKMHLENIFQKLKVSRRVQLAVLTRAAAAEAADRTEDATERLRAAS